MARARLDSGGTLGLRRWNLFWDAKECPPFGEMHAQMKPLDDTLETRVRLGKYPVLVSWNHHHLP